MFTEAPLTIIARTWMQLEYPSTDEWKMISLICGILKGINLQNRNRFTDVENKLIITKGHR